MIKEIQDIKCIFFPASQVSSQETLKHAIGISSIVTGVRHTSLEKKAIFCCSTTKSKNLENTSIFNARLRS